MIRFTWSVARGRVRGANFVGFGSRCGKRHGQHALTRAPRSYLLSHGRRGAQERKKQRSHTYSPILLHAAHEAESSEALFFSSLSTRIFTVLSVPTIAV